MARDTPFSPIRVILGGVLASKVTIMSARDTDLVEYIVPTYLPSRQVERLALGGEHLT